MDSSSFDKTRFCWVSSSGTQSGCLDPARSRARLWEDCVKFRELTGLLLLFVTPWIFSLPIDCKEDEGSITK